MRLPIIASLSIIISGIILLTLSFELQTQILGIISLVLLVSGGVYLYYTLRNKNSLFVCGECNLTFLEEPDLRKHYAIEHAKKDSEEKKD
jgi:hypothetical protein